MPLSGNKEAGFGETQTDTHYIWQENVVTENNKYKTEKKKNEPGQCVGTHQGETHQGKISKINMSTLGNPKYFIYYIATTDR